MKITKADPGCRCMTKVSREIDANTVRIDDCGEPAVVAFTTWAGRYDYACREHAIALLASFSSIMGPADGEGDAIEGPYAIGRRHDDGTWGFYDGPFPSLDEARAADATVADHVLVRLVRDGDHVVLYRWDPARRWVPPDGPGQSRRTPPACPYSSN